MPVAARSEGRGSLVLLIAAVCLVAANMRPAITALGPLLDQIGDDTGMTASALGVLAAVPLVAWAIFSPMSLGLSRRFGQTRVLLVSLLVLLVGTLVRSLPGPVVSLWIGYAIIGIGIAAWLGHVSVLLAAVGRRRVTPGLHNLIDPVVNRVGRSLAERMANPPYPGGRQAINRIPYVPGSVGYGAGSAAMSSSCGCG